MKIVKTSNSRNVNSNEIANSNRQSTLVKEHYLNLMKIGKDMVEKNQLDKTLNSKDKSDSTRDVLTSFRCPGRFNPLMNPEYSGLEAVEIFKMEIECLQSNELYNFSHDGPEKRCKKILNPMFKQLIATTRHKDKLRVRDDLLKETLHSRNQSAIKRKRIVTVMSNNWGEHETNKMLCETKRNLPEEEIVTVDISNDEVEVLPAEKLSPLLGTEPETIVMPSPSKKIKPRSEEDVLAIILSVIDMVIESSFTKPQCDILPLKKTDRIAEDGITSDSVDPAAALLGSNGYLPPQRFDSKDVENGQHCNQSIPESNLASEVEREIEFGKQHIRERLKFDPSEYDEFDRRQKSLKILEDPIYQKFTEFLYDDSDQPNVSSAKSLAEHIIQVLALLGFDHYLLRMLTEIGGEKKIT